jgi:glutathione peroxidase-family protein
MVRQGVKFQMMAKVDVNGPKTAPVWKFLKERFPGDVKWNFDTHFLVGRNGTVCLRFPSTCWLAGGRPERLVALSECCLSNRA